MKANELMIGDWVYSYYSAPEKWQPRQWTITFYEGNFIGMADPETSCRPIPLTTEILEKNGFTKTHTQYTEYMWSHPSRCTFLYQYDPDGEICLENTEIELNYVHQLQHALRLCGLNELADNLKVE